MKIQYLSHHEIDKNQWDACIRDSLNGCIYAWSWYLDAVSPGWEALVGDDYHTVMPLTWRQKWGFKYLFRPLLSQQHGIFSRDLISSQLVGQFTNQIPAKFRLIEICLNKFNECTDASFVISYHTSCELDLIQEYSLLQKNYSQNTQRNLKKMSQYNIQYDSNLRAEDFLRLMWDDSSAGSAVLLETNNLFLLQGLLKSMKEQQAGRILGARDAEGQLIAAALFGFSHGRWYYLAPVSSDQGRKQLAAFGILDQLIREQSEKALILDFEGSDIPGVARFYTGFGAKTYSYPGIRRNRLPWPVRIIKGK